MHELVLLKLGGSLITEKDKPFTHRQDVIDRLSREIHEARSSKKLPLVLGHGGGSYPHRPAHEYKTHLGVAGDDSYRGIALVQDAASRLNRIVVSSLLDAGENAISFQPSAFVLCSRGGISEMFTKPLEETLKMGMLPVVYGDVGLDTAQGSCIISTELILGGIANRMGAARVLYAGITDGVFDRDPTKHKDARHIPEITRKNFDSVRDMLGGSGSVDVTGGMLHKVEEALEMADKGVPVQIVNGLTPNSLRDALLGRKVKGTIIR